MKLPTVYRVTYLKQSDDRFNHVIHLAITNTIEAHSELQAQLMALELAQGHPIKSVKPIYSLYNPLI